MKNGVRSLFVRKRKDFNVEAKSLSKDLIENLKIPYHTLDIFVRYSVQGLTKEQFKAAKWTVFGEIATDLCYNNIDQQCKDAHVIAIESLPGQYDVRANWASQCLSLLGADSNVIVKVAKIIVIKGDISSDQLDSIKSYIINKVESRETIVTPPQSLDTQFPIPENIKIVDRFIKFTANELKDYLKNSPIGFAMDLDDIISAQKYFASENRNPTETELKVLDTYWSDHCRHTTFTTTLKNVTIVPKYIEDVYNDILTSMGSSKLCLMDIATHAASELRAAGKTPLWDISEENNACCLKINVKVGSSFEEWFVMFKNETHNHPTEIEPFGGAATCLGGAIRDPLSGRTYVYQAMRITGCSDPRKPINETIPGKLPQRKITITAANGFSSYGNQIGLATGFVKEVYHDGYVAKRLEIGAVLGAAPVSNITRQTPKPGDVIFLLGGKTGRDGCGGATGASKEHNENSLENCAAEVQKGNPTVERAIQRLLRNPKASKIIKKCNDFGAGGVAVAVGELAPGLTISLDDVPKKYEGLNGTEIAISESQERMACVVSPENAAMFITLASEENLDATIVAIVEQEERIIMTWRGETIVNISREFLDSSGAQKTSDALILQPTPNAYFSDFRNHDLIELLSDLNTCSQKGLVERFDSTIGGNTITLPFGGKSQLTPIEAMTSRIPVLNGDTTAGTIMSYGFNPKLSSFSPYHGATYAIVESVSKIVASGGDLSTTYLSLQEFFERLKDNPLRWGKPLSALLGAYNAQKKLGIAAIGGKDSMSGTFKDYDVPPTLVSFAVSTISDVGNVITPEFKKPDSFIVLYSPKLDENYIFDFDDLLKNYNIISSLIQSKVVLSAQTVGEGGIAVALAKMSFGNSIGFKITDTDIQETCPGYGSIILEVDNIFNIPLSLDYIHIGHTHNLDIVSFPKKEYTITELVAAWEKPLTSVFPITAPEPRSIEKVDYTLKSTDFTNTPSVITSTPKVFIPVFPGTNCEYDTERAFIKAGAKVSSSVFKNLSSTDISDSVTEMIKQMSQSQIVCFPGGFSAGDEPDGSGKFIVSILQNESVRNEISEFLARGGLILGICNGFQALIKSGLIPYGRVEKLSRLSPTLTHNTINRHISKMVGLKVTSRLSPWLYNVDPEEIYQIPVSHGEGRLVFGDKETVDVLNDSGRVALKYIGVGDFNPNGSMDCIAGLTNIDGRILGLMPHPERYVDGNFINIPGCKNLNIISSGVDFFKKS